GEGSGGGDDTGTGSSGAAGSAGGDGAAPGCGCRSGSPEAPWWSWLLLAIPRRRRGRALAQRRRCSR
ncbi:MAG: hypothetical protein KC501_23625, partial [Myxococcales bacterium]|nr:hypothetical protein [Myxococcales bacterium]